MNKQLQRADGACAGIAMKYDLIANFLQMRSQHVLLFHIPFHVLKGTNDY